MKIYIATGNHKKFGQISAILSELDVELEQANPHLHEDQILDMEKISKHKAMQAFEALNAPVIVDDSGLFIGKYNQFPGVYSKVVYMGMGFEGIKTLFDEGDRGFFQAIISYMDEQLDEPVSFSAQQYGTLSKNNPDIPTPDDPMPYSYLFMGEGETEFRNRYDAKTHKPSHRAKAAAELRDWLQKHRLK